MIEIIGAIVGLIILSTFFSILGSIRRSLVRLVELAERQSAEQKRVTMRVIDDQQSDDKLHYDMAASELSIGDNLFDSKGNTFRLRKFARRGLIVQNAEGDESWILPIDANASKTARHYPVQKT